MQSRCLLIMPADYDSQMLQVQQQVSDTAPGYVEWESVNCCSFTIFIIFAVTKHNCSADRPGADKHTATTSCFHTLCGYRQ
jgi:hypothetical protein